MSSSLHSMLQQAMNAFQDNDLSRAHALLKKIIKLDKQNLPALHMLGLISASQLDYRSAVNFFKKALLIDPESGSIHFNLANALVDCGHFKEAINHYIKSTEFDPTNPRPWLGQGRAFTNLGNHHKALFCYEQAIVLNPKYIEAVVNKATTLNALKNFDAAILCAETAITLNNNIASAWAAKGHALHEKQLYRDAIFDYDKALVLNPYFHEVYTRKGLALHQLGLFEEAIICADKSLKINPNLEGVWANKAAALYELMRYEESIDHYDAALSINSSFAEALANKGAALKELKRYDEVIVHYDKALKLKPNMDWFFGDLIHTKMKVADWSNLESLKKTLVDQVIENYNVSYPLAILSLVDDPYIQFLCSQTFSLAKYSSTEALGPFPPKLLPSNKIKLGYFSADFRTHPVGLLISELFELHDRAHFEVYVFSLHKSPYFDSVTERLKKGADKFINADEMSPFEIAKLSRELEVDIAIDLSGHTQFSKTNVFAFRAAPIQVHWLGYPGTLGAKFYDFILADQTVIPDQQRKFYTEKVLYLPDTFMVDDTKRMPSNKVFTRTECGIPENCFVFCSFSADYKFNPQLLDSWSRILKKVENSVLWLSENNVHFRANLLKEFAYRGIAIDRIIFATRLDSVADHLARHSLANLFLDTHPYNAHSSALDSLKSGVPIITLMGQSFSSRVAASLLNAISLPELITYSYDEYEALAIRLANDSTELIQIQYKLAVNKPEKPLFNTSLFTKNIESLFTGIYKNNTRST